MAAAEGTRRTGALSRLRAGVDWIAVGAIALTAVFVQPALHAGFRGDDTWISVERGRIQLSHESLGSHLWTYTKLFWDSGRPNVLGVVEGVLTLWAVDENAFAYHALILALTLAAAGFLYALVRELGLPGAGALLVVTLLAAAIQFRSYHDPMLGYAGSIQAILILTLASLLTFVRGLRRDDRRLLILSFLLFLPCPALYEGSYTLVFIYGGVALLERRGLAAFKGSMPFLALGGCFIVLSLYLRQHATAVPTGYDDGGGPLETLRTYVIQLFTPLPASNVFFRADYASFLPLGGKPTSGDFSEPSGALPSCS